MTKAQLMDAKVTPAMLNAVADYIQTNANSVYTGVEASGLINNEGFIRGWLQAGAFLRHASEQSGQPTPSKPAPYTESQHPEAKSAKSDQ